MTISIKPTASGSTIEQDGSTVISIESDRSVDVDSGTLHVDATNNLVGVGTNSPNDITGTGLRQLVVGNNSGNNGVIVNSSSSGDSAYSFAVNNVKLGRVGYDYLNNMTFQTNNTERMRINSSGYVFFGGTTTTQDDHAHFESNGVLVIDRAAANGRTGIAFFNGSTNCGNIILNLASTQYLTSSDYRLKENVVPMSGSIDRLKQLKPSTWSWVQDGSHGEGFIAHEAQAIVPESVNGTKDAMRTEEYEVTAAVLDDDDNVVTEAVMGTREVPDYQGIDQSKLVPLLTAALQEAITKIETLTTRIEALEAK